MSVLKRTLVTFFSLFFCGLHGLDAQDLFQQEIERRLLLQKQIAKDEKNFLKTVELEQMKRQMPSAELVQLIAEGKNAFPSAELVESQKKKFKTLQKDCLKKLKDLLGDEQVSDRLEWAKYKYIDWTNYPKGAREKFQAIKDDCKKKLFEILLPVQIKGFAKTGLVNGIPRIVTESTMQEVIGITQEQKRKIQLESNKLAKEIEEFVHKTRTKAAKIAVDNLTEQQRQKLFEVYGEKQVYRLLSSVQLRILYRQHLFTDDPPKGSSNKDLPKGKHVDWTELKRPVDGK